MLGRPGREGDASAFFEDPEHLLKDDRRPRREDVAVLTEHDIERGIGVGQGLGISFGEVDVEGADGGIVARPLQQHRRQIKAGYFGAAARRGDRDDAGAAGDVQQSLPGLHLREGHELGCRNGGDDLDRQER